jgi:hypothetical protein
MSKTRYHYINYAEAFAKHSEATIIQGLDALLSAHPNDYVTIFFTKEHSAQCVRLPKLLNLFNQDRCRLNGYNKEDLASASAIKKSITEDSPKRPQGIASHVPLVIYYGTKSIDNITQVIADDMRFCLSKPMLAAIAKHHDMPEKIQFILRHSNKPNVIESRFPGSNERSNWHEQDYSATISQEIKLTSTAEFKGHATDEEPHNEKESLLAADKTDSASTAVSLATTVPVGESKIENTFARKKAKLISEIRKLSQPSCAWCCCFPGGNKFAEGIARRLETKENNQALANEMLNIIVQYKKPQTTSGQKTIAKVLNKHLTTFQEKPTSQYKTALNNRPKP